MVPCKVLSWQLAFSSCSSRFLVVLRVVLVAFRVVLLVVGGVLVAVRVVLIAVSSCQGRICCTLHCTCERASQRRTVFGHIPRRVCRICVHCNCRG